VDFFALTHLPWYRTLQLSHSTTHPAQASVEDLAYFRTEARLSSNANHRHTVFILHAIIVHVLSFLQRARGQGSLQQNDLIRDYLPFKTANADCSQLQAECLAAIWEHPKFQ
jgi:hypothetical protein